MVFFSVHYMNEKKKQQNIWISTVINRQKYKISDFCFCFFLLFVIPQFILLFQSKQFCRRRLVLLRARFYRIETNKIVFFLFRCFRGAPLYSARCITLTGLRNCIDRRVRRLLAKWKTLDNGFVVQRTHEFFASAHLLGYAVRRQRRVRSFA
jgi:hypothetical protein